jgi:hypothetical protein
MNVQISPGGPKEIIERKTVIGEESEIDIKIHADILGLQLLNGK